MSLAPFHNPSRPGQFEGSEIHPAIHAGRWLLADLLSTLFFVGVFAVTHSVYVATGLGIAAGLAQILYLKMRRSPIDAMQWMSLGLVVVFGGASLLTHDPRFVMFKPTLIYAAIGAVMMKPGWMVRYMTADVLDWARDLVERFGYVWAGLMFLTGVLNIALVAHGDTKLWGWFLGVFPLASKLVLFGIQYFTTRAVVVSRMRAAQPV
jgi:intracellular septation protein A